MKPLFSGVFRALSLPVSGEATSRRTFIGVDPILTSRYELDQQITLTGDFEIKMDIAPFGIISSNALCGASSTYIRLADTNTLVFSYASGLSLNIALSSSVETGKLQGVKVVRAGLNVEVFKGGSLVGSGTCSTLTDFIIEQVAAKNFANYFSGIIANIEFIDLTDTNNNQCYSLDQATGATETSLEGGNTLTYANIPESNRELFEFDGVSVWNNISPPVQVLPATIEVV